MAPNSDVTPAILEVAALWRQRQEQGEWSIDDQVEFEAWLESDERHVKAVGMVGDLYGLFEEHAASTELLTERRAAVDRFQAHAKGRLMAPAAFAAMSRRRLAFGLAAAAAIGLLGGLPVLLQGDVYRTKLGERRIIRLEDGSVLSLDAMTRVSVRYSRDERRLTLEQGQARFDVAPDKARPFSVVARDRQVIATGTAFNIDIISPEVRVTLIEGHVVVASRSPSLMRSEPPSGKAVELRPGQALVAKAEKPGNLVLQADVKQAVAWQQGQLIFQDEPLGRAVDRINRYTDHKIVVADAQAAAILVSGAFNAGDTNAFLEALDGYVPVSITNEPDEIIIRSTQGLGR